VRSASIPSARSEPACPERPSSATAVPRRREPNPIDSKADILAVAAWEFARYGFSGARVDEIASKTKTSKRMLYYYFGSKEELYRCVLRESYRALRLKEGMLDLKSLRPIDALAAIIEFNFDHHMRNEHFIRMVMNENVLMGQNIREIPSIKSENASVIEMLGEICERGAEDGSMRAQIDPVDLHMSISALCFFNVANRHTFSFLFDRDMTSDAASSTRRRAVVDMVIGSVAMR
jgi:AcrR family transcriptional regulator